jgi:hypothetical protein
MPTRETKEHPYDGPDDPLLGRTVLYHASENDDVQEFVPFPLCAGVETFAAIVARVHRGGKVDVMVVDPSKGPMPRWKVPYATSPRPGHWTDRVRRG